VGLAVGHRRSTVDKKPPSQSSAESAAPISREAVPTIAAVLATMRRARKAKAGPNFWKFAVMKRGCCGSTHHTKPGDTATGLRRLVRGELLNVGHWPVSKWGFAASGHLRRAMDGTSILFFRTSKKCFRIGKRFQSENSLCALGNQRSVKDVWEQGYRSELTRSCSGGVSSMGMEPPGVDGFHHRPGSLTGQ